MFNTAYGCTDCLAVGHRPEEFKRHFIYEEPNQLRTKDDLEAIFYGLDNFLDEAPSFGVYGRSPFDNLAYLDRRRCVSVEPFHVLLPGVFKRSFSCFSDTSCKPKKCFLIKRKRVEIDNRIRKIQTNSLFKRKVEVFSRVKDFKGNQMFDFAFYLAPIVFRGIVHVDVYNHFLLLISTLSSLWRGNFPRADLEVHREAIRDYQRKVKEFYRLIDMTFNVHQLEHLVDLVSDHGPLSYNNAFLSESENRHITDLVTNFYGAAEQISSRYELNFLSSKLLDSDRCFETSFRPYGQPYKHNNHTCYKKIIRNKTVVSLFYNNRTKSADYYIETADERFFKVLYFVQESNETSFVGFEIRRLGGLSFNREEERLQLDYIHDSIVTNVKLKLHISLIKHKVLFIPKFSEAIDLDDNHTLSSIPDRDVGFVIQMKLKHHN